jgi:hypothetical protein
VPRLARWARRRYATTVQEIAFSRSFTTIWRVGGGNIHLRRVQSARALLATLFIAAQVIGVVSLLCNHTKEIYERAVAVTDAPAEANPANAASDRADPDGDLDDDCCALDSLAGPLPNVACITADHLVSPHVFPTPAAPLAGRHSRVLERPPKHTPSSDGTQA